MTRISMLDKLSWLHLSDFHFTANGDTFGQNVSCNALLEDIPKRLSTEYPLQFVGITGDIAFSGQKDEYAGATAYFTTLASAIGLDVRQLCLVPGNHDVDRTVARYTYRGVLSELHNQQLTDAFLGDDPERDQLLARQAEFTNFRNTLLDDSTPDIRERGLARVRRFEVCGLRIAVLELNSAWLSGTDDEPGRLLIGERQVIDALELAREFRPHLSIALAHHPFEWLCDFDSLSCTRRLIPNIQVFHSGHIHRHHAHVPLLPHSQCLHSTAGASHETRHYRNSYNLIECDLGTGRCTVRHFEYSVDDGVFSEHDSTAYHIPAEGDIRASITEIATADGIRNTVPVAREYANFMSALLTGALSEVPISLGDDQFSLGSQTLPVEQQFPEVRDFLRLSNILRINEAESLADILTQYAGYISALAELLVKISKADADFRESLENRIIQAKRLCDGHDDHPTHYQNEYLEDLAIAGDVPALLAEARRYATSQYPEVRLTATRHMASALSNMEDDADRRKGLDIALGILNDPSAAADDYCTASLLAESLDKRAQSLDLAIQALGRWPADDRLRRYCRLLATQTGSKQLRRQLDETQETRK